VETLEPLETAFDPGAILVTVSVFAAVVRSIVQAVRRQWPFIDGLAVQAIAVALGALGAWAFDLQGAQALLEVSGAAGATVGHVAVDYLVTGGAIAAAAGLFADVAKSPAPVVVEVDENGAPL
jgi:hypothetical protein